MATRARKILELVVENTTTNYEFDTVPISGDKHKKYNDTNDASHELLNENCVSIQMENESTVEGRTMTESVNYVDKENEVTILKLPTENSLANVFSLVPYYDSDSTLSENDDIPPKNFIMAADDKNEKHHQHSQLSSNSSSSSSSSSCSSSSNSSSSSSDSESGQSTQQLNPHPLPTTHITVNETTDDEVIENTPPQQQKVHKHHPRISKTNHNYYISPVYSDESEANLSDTDPTFTNIEPRRKRNYFFDQSSSSSTSSTEPNKPKKSAPKRGRKRVSNPSQWKQNKIKRLRNKGKSYVAMSKKKVSARCLKQPCTEKCRLKCTTMINTDTRYELFRRFWDLADLEKQRAYISTSMTDIQPRYKYTNAETPRHNNKAFHFIIDGKYIRVCKTFFRATLDISDRMIFTVQTKVNENNFSLKDLRGCHKNHKKINPEVRAAIVEHINSIPKVESHYLRASSTREYIEGGKTIKDLFKDFKAQQQQNNKEAGTYSLYYKIFTSEFNLSFFSPKKDQCDLCNSYNNANIQNNDLQETYLRHLEEKNCSRIHKVDDRNKVSEKVRVSVYDLQAVLQCPRGDSSSFYYKSKLNSYNFTITELTSKETKVAYKNVNCYFWSECDAKRGAIEIGSCIWAYLKSVSDDGDHLKEVIFYSDNCCGQNKNKYITSLYLHAVQTLNISTITHKFLIRGHMQNEADSVHSLIEKEIKKNLKSGPIYTPDQYIALIKNAKKSQPPLIVHEMTFDSFYDLKLLQEEWGYNYSTNVDGESVNWNEIKILKVSKENQTNFLYKTSYKDQDYKEVNVRNKRKKMPSIKEITLQTAYSTKQEISENKKKDLKDLINKGLIPSFYAGFYNSII